MADAGLVNLTHGSIAEGVAEMRGTVRDQAVLKRLAGVSARGRPVSEPYLHLVASWPPGYKPSREEVEEVAHGILDALDLSEHQAIWVLHTDTDQHHVHIAANRVNPTTGRTVKLSFEKRKLSQWALENEQKRGCIEVPGRLVRKEWRDEARELFQQRDEARATGDARRAWELTRTLEQHRDRRPAIEPTRGPGGEARSPEERRRWLLHFDQERDERERRGTTAVAKDQRAARVRLSLRIDRDRVRAERRQQRAERRTARVAKRRQQRATAVAAVAAGARRVGAALADGARWTGPVAAAGTRRVGTALADGASWTGPVVAAGTRLVGRALAAGARRTDRAIVAAPSRTVDRILALIPGGDVAEYQDAWDRAYHASSRRPRPSAPTPRLLTPRMSVTTRVSLTLA